MADKQITTVDEKKIKTGGEQVSPKAPKKKFSVAAKDWCRQLVDTDEKFGSMQFFKSYAYIIVGTFLFVLADIIFAVPYHLAPGGVYGLANVLHILTGTRIAIFLMLFEIPLLIIGSIILGPMFGIKTIFSTVLGWGFTALIENTWGYEPLVHVGEFITNAASLPLDAIAISHSTAYFIPDYLLNTLLAGLLYGIGIGLIFKSGATSGGSDIVSMIINKYTHISLGTLVIIVDGIIALSSLLISPDLRLPAYSILLIFIEGKIIDLVVDGTKSYKTLLIVTDYYYEVRDVIINDIKRGGTCVKAQGMYEGVERTLIYTTVAKTEYVKLKLALRKVDPNAFISVVESNEVFGKRFKDLPKK